MKKYFLFLIFSFYCVSCFSWDAYGHKLVGSIAKVYTNKAALDSVNKYLGKTSWEEAATWMDEIRADHTYDYLAPMHYVDIAEGKTYEPTDSANLINELTKVIAELRDRSKLSNDKINEDLKIIFHLVGDLHQPLHTGYPDDKGGNNVEVYTMDGRSNLHKVWDSYMIDSHTKFKSEVVEMSKHLTKSEIKKLQTVDIMSWMNESRSYLPAVYDFKKGTIDEKYIAVALPIIERQVLNAGIRLSGVLNSIFM